MPIMLQDNYIRNLMAPTTVEISDGTSADCDTIPVADGGSVFWFFDSTRGTIRRAGVLFTTWNSDGTAANLVSLSTASDETYGLGDSSDLSMTVAIEGGNVILRATSVNNWIVKIKRLRL